MPVHVLKECGRGFDVKGESHCFLTSALDGILCLASRRARLS